MRKLRSSVIISGAILGRCKEVTFSYPRRLWNWK
jgi:UDP-N-acetylglucosamine enolpyruvyl transferase